MSSVQLAINGGPKAVGTLPNRFSFGREEKAAVDALFEECIRTGNPIGYNGPQEEAFCKEFAEFLGGGYADGVNAGTNAVYVALKSLELPPFSEVIVSCVTDPGGMMPVAELNCIPIPADTAPGSYNTGARQIEERLTDRTSAIVVAHIGGEPADMPEIMALAEKHGLPVVEDCAQSHMALINGKLAGTFGTLGTFSLMFGKHICTGGLGGAVFTANEELYWKVRRAADRGKPINMPGHTNVRTAINCNMDEIHAAIGREQLKKLPGIVNRRKAFVNMLLERGLAELPGIRIPQKDLKPGFEPCYWWWRLRFDAAAMRCTKEEFCTALAAEGANVGVSYTVPRPDTQEWFLNRASCHPWNNPLCKSDIRAEYPTPNCNQTMSTDFNFYILESYGESEADQLMEAFQKVSRYYSR